MPASSTSGKISKRALSVTTIGGAILAAGALFSSGARHAAAGNVASAHTANPATVDPSLAAADPMAATASESSSSETGRASQLPADQRTFPQPQSSSSSAMGDTKEWRIDQPISSGSDHSDNRSSADAADGASIYPVSDHDGSEDR